MRPGMGLVFLSVNSQVALYAMFAMLLLVAGGVGLARGYVRR